MVFVRQRPAVIAICGLLAAVLAFPSVWSGSIEASGPLQDTSAVDISGKECAFWLDFNGDGEGDEPVDAHPDSFTLQETEVVGGCEFKVNTEAEATLVLVSELTGWTADVTITREPGMEKPFTLHPADNEIPDLQGGMTVEVRHAGSTPRSGKVRTLRDGYEHEVQVPLPFRLLEVTVVTPDGRRDRLEVSVQSASGAFLHAQQRVFASTVDADAGTKPIVELASGLMDQGYPQIADQVLALEEVGIVKRGSSAWMFAAIGLSIAIVATVLAGGAFAYLTRRVKSDAAGENLYDFTSR